jgi:hypothetical protein
VATERLAPDTLLEQTNLSGAVTAIDEDPDASAGDWLTAQSNNADSIARVSFPTPSGALTGTQEFRVLVRKMGGSGTPTARIELYENGVLVSTPLSDTGVTSTSGVVLSGSWAATAVSGNANVECRVFGVKSGGSPALRAAIEVGAIEWNVQYSVEAESHSGTVTITGSGTGTATGSKAAAGSLALSAGGAVTAAGFSGRSGTVAIDAAGSVSASGMSQRSGTVSVSGTGAGTASGTSATEPPPEFTGTVAINATGAGTAGGSKHVSGVLVITNAGTFQITGSSARSGSVSINGSGAGMASGTTDGEPSSEDGPWVTHGVVHLGHPPLNH